MNQAESEMWEDDGELAAFSGEMRQEEPRMQAMLHVVPSPFDKEIDKKSVLGLVRKYNEVAAVLREFVARHPEDADLARRVKHYL